jgi:hypothetical protein
VQFSFGMELEPRTAPQHASKNGTLVVLAMMAVFGTAFAILGGLLFGLTGVFIGIAVGAGCVLAVATAILP